MRWQKTILNLATLSFTLCLGMAIFSKLPMRVQAQTRPILLPQNTGNSWEIAQAFQPPNRGAPSVTAGGASRGSSCRKDSDTKSLTALIPKDSFGLTLTNNPKFFFYIPETSAQAGEFVLKNDQDEDIYRKTFTIVGIPGIVSFNPLAEANIPPLQADKNYKWFFSLICDSNNRLEDIFVQGWLQITQPDATLTSQLKEAQDRDRLTVYAKNGIWYDAVTTIAELRRKDPNNTDLQNSWMELLKSVGLESVSSEPLIDCCKPANTTTATSP